MAVFTVTIVDAHPAFAGRVSSAFPECHQFSDRVWIVVSDETPQAIAQKLGVTERDAEGKVASQFGHILVSQMTSNYWGFASSGMWEWMKAKFERSA